MQLEKNKKYNTEKVYTLQSLHLSNRKLLKKRKEVRMKLQMIKIRSY